MAEFLPNQLHHLEMELSFLLPQPLSWQYVCSLIHVSRNIDCSQGELNYVPSSTICRTSRDMFGRSFHAANKFVKGIILLRLTFGAFWVGSPMPWSGWPARYNHTYCSITLPQKGWGKIAFHYKMDKIVRDKMIQWKYTVGVWGRKSPKQSNFRIHDI